jgi:hypothetical protein
MPRSPLVLALTAMLLSTGCATGASDVPRLSVCPPWPVAGPAVAAELGRLPEAEYPATWEWVGRLAVLRDQLAACGGR